MFDFKGFEDWIEIFAGGPQTDSAGVEHDGDEVMDKALKTFDPSVHEPPVVVGHPKDNAPAFGWVAGLKRVGNKLLARFKDVNPEFEKMVRDGLFKKRSASFYPDGRLRHVGFLGAAPPAVKGLADVRFEDEGSEFQFSQMTCNEEENGMGDFDWTKFWQGMFSGSAQAGHPASAAPAAGPGQGDAGKNQYTEKDIEAAREQAKTEAREKADAEYAEKEKKTASDTRKKDFCRFCDTLVADGKLPPSMGESGLKEFGSILAGVEDEVEFSEGGKSQKIHPVEWLKSFLGNLGESRIFREVATKERAGAGKEGGEMDYAEAMKGKV